MNVINHKYKLLDKINFLKEQFKDCDDLVVREFGYHIDKNYKLAIVYIDGLSDKKLIGESVLNNIMIIPKLLDENKSIQNIKDYIKEKTISTTEIKDLVEDNEIIKNILIGETILLIDGIKEVILLSSRGWPSRSVSEPQSETVIRGPRDGFTETLKVNTSLVRRRIRDTNLKLKNYSLGKRSQTDVALLYVEDLVNKDVLETVKKRLNDIDIDIIQESGNIEQLIEDRWLSIFPQLQYTERPDIVVNSLYNGRVAILVDNTPFGLIAPVTLTTLLHSPEDMYEKWIISTLIRLLRFVAAIFSFILPALYIAITSYHPDMLPTDLVLYIAATRQGVPFSAFLEAFMMEFTIELLREAGIRLPKAIGSTIGIVGGLVIGQAAVQAGIVSPLMVIIVAITAISSFTIPNYNLAIGFRIVRFIFMISAVFFGLYGIVLVALMLFIHLTTLKSFGVMYLDPFVNLQEKKFDLRDSIVRFPVPSLKFRNISYMNRFSRKYKDKRNEKIREDEE